VYFLGGAEKMSRELPGIGISEIYIFLIKKNFNIGGFFTQS
jgi:hypothetical protein